MLKKLLKYDLKAVFKYWWIGACTALTFSFTGGMCDYLWANSDIVLPDVIELFLIIGGILSYLSIGAFVVMSIILLYVRVYKNQFTDEGYLTFTLPVKKITLINAKFLASIITYTATFIITTLNIFVRYFFTYPEDFMDLKSIIPYFKNLNIEYDGLLPIYILEAVLGFFAVVSAVSIFAYFCITLAGLLFKKAKVFATISVLFISGLIFIFFIFIIWWFGISNIESMLYFNTIPNVVLSLIIFAGILIVSIFTTIIYAVEYLLIHKKLNLN